MSGNLFFSRRILLACIVMLNSPANIYAQGEWSGNVSFETRLFVEDAIHSGQDGQNASLAAEPEYYVDWDGGDQRFALSAFARVDINDDERTHVDLREFYWRKTLDDVEIKLGIAKVFWGVAESQHLVDIINQDDFVENIDAEDKLGQPMVQFTKQLEVGALEVFVLPYFRERTFSGEDGRLRTALPIDVDNPIYESGAAQQHVDLAVRWSGYIGDWDIGLAHFSGTSRDPLLVPTLRNGNTVLVPFYTQIEQTSLDLQVTRGDWLWKLELISRDELDGRYTAFVGGLEYTLIGTPRTPMDLGLLVEYHFDDRVDNATTSFENDLFLGTRWVFNDVQSTELLAGIIIDMDNQTSFGNIEASRRIGDRWKVSLEGRIFTNIDSQDVLFDLRQDDYFELQVARYF